jgi:Glycosyltransferase WbsX
VSNNWPSATGSAQTIGDNRSTLCLGKRHWPNRLRGLLVGRRKLKRFCMPTQIHLIVVTLSLLLAAIDPRVATAQPQSTQDSTASRAPAKLILAHYMPWFEAKPVSPRWGWHWTMNAFDPEQVTDGKRAIASHYQPLIGPYDSSEVAVIEYHLLTMKLAGIDGVIVDWYGLTDFRDYAALHRNTTRTLETAERLKMKFVICYEDQTIPALVDGQRIKATDRVSHAANEIQWLSKYWFKSPSYVSLDGKPLLLSFGQSGLSDAEWSQCLEQAQTPVTYFSQHHRRTAAVGAFDWPVPSAALDAVERFQKDARSWPRSIPVAFPRFVDIYAEANLHASYGRFPDDHGKSFSRMLERALQSNAPIVQLATWNDWGEGTQIEPSLEFGYRDLETVQTLRRKYVNPKFTLQPPDLQLPHRLLVARRAATADQKRLDEIVDILVRGQILEARSAIESLK